MKNILLFGASGHAKVVMSIIAAGEKYRVAGVVVSDPGAVGDFFGVPIFGGEENLPRFLEEVDAESLVLAVGDNHARHLLHKRVMDIVPRCRFPEIIHPSAQIAPGVSVGEGSVVAACATLNTDARIGDFCIVDTGVNVGHDSMLGDYSSFAPHAALGGDVRVGDFSVVGLGVNIIERVHIGEQTVVGAGATVMDDLPAYAVAYGTPARAVRTRDAGEPFYKPPRRPEP